MCLIIIYYHYLNVSYFHIYYHVRFIKIFITIKSIANFYHRTYNIKAIKYNKYTLQIQLVFNFNIYFMIYYNMHVRIIY